MSIGLNSKVVASASFYIATLLLVFIGCNILLSSVLFILSVSITPLHLFVGVLLTIAVGILLMKNHSARFIMAVFSVVTLVISLTLVLTAITSDDTVDAHGYHETAVGAMRYGWNPVYESIGDFNDSEKSPIKLEGTYYEKWNNHYPKAHWIYAANIYSVTGKIETGRSMVMVIIAALFFLTLHYALLRFSLGLSFVLAVIVALNPISVMQLFSYYNDGMLGNLLLMTILLLTMLLDKKYVGFGRWHYVLIALALILMINLKFTGLVYAGIYCVAYLAYIVASKQYRRSVVPLLVTGGAALVIGLLIVGLSVYPKNLVEKGSPLYPLIGGHNEVDIITPNEPMTFHEMSNAKKLLISNFSETDNISEASGREPELKVPFTFTMAELKYLSYVDPRIAGYGVWFGGILLISVAWLLYCFIKIGIRKDWRSFWLLALPLLPTLIIVLAVSESWWARYVPQLFLVPALALVAALLLKRSYLAHTLIFLMLFNSLLTLSLQIGGQRDGLAYRASEEKRVDELLENGKYTPKLYLGDFGGLAYRYYEKYGKVTILAEKPVGEDAKNSLSLAKEIIVSK